MPTVERYTLLIVGDEKTDELGTITQIDDEAIVEFQSIEREEICLLCLTQTNLYPTSSSHYAQQFNNFNFIQEPIGFELPEVVCKSCIQQLDEIGSFLAKCRDSLITYNSVAQIESQQYAEEEVDKSGEIKQKNFDRQPNECLDSSDEKSKLESLVVESCCLMEEAEINKITYVENKVKNAASEESVNDKSDTLKLCHKCGLLVEKLTPHYKKSLSCWPKMKKCQICNLSFTQQDSLNQHKQVHKADKFVRKRIMCHICSKMFTKVGNLARHLKIHKYGKEYMCEICGKAFTRGEYLRDHQNVHLAHKPYSCKQCGNNFARQPSLHVHQQKFHSSDSPLEATNPKRKLICNICDRHFSKQGFQNHVQSHSDNSEKRKLPLCKECNIIFENSVDFREHLLVCENRRYQCTDCHKRFKSVVHLEHHFRVHTGVRPFICPKCDNTFRTQAHLKRHTMLIHGINRGQPFSCKICPKVFYLKENLVVHERIHSGEKPYLCHVCEKRFIDASARKKHVIKCHGEHEVKNIVPLLR